MTLVSNKKIRGRVGDLAFVSATFFPGAWNEFLSHKASKNKWQMHQSIIHVRDGQSTGGGSLKRCKSHCHTISVLGFRLTLFSIVTITSLPLTGNDTLVGILAWNETRKHETNQNLSFVVEFHIFELSSSVSRGRVTHLHFLQSLCPPVLLKIRSVSGIRLQLSFVLLILLFRLVTCRLRMRNRSVSRRGPRSCAS